MTFNLSETNLERIQEHVLHKREEALLNELNEMHPADIAELLDRLDLDEARYVHSLLGGEVAAEVINELPGDRREDLLEDFSAKEIAEEVIEQLDSDDAADVIAELPEDVQQEVLANIDDSELKSFSCTVDVADPHADSDEVKHEYGYELVKEMKGPYDAIIVAVNHAEYADKDEAWFKSLLTQKGILVDLKGIYRRKVKTLAYWSL